MKEPYELFSVECGPGWSKIIDPLIQRCKEEGVHITQIKEKFGGLRFYVAGASDSLYEAIDAAEKLSYKTCEECGKEGHLRSGGWIRTLCDEHAGGREKMNNRMFTDPMSLLK